MSSTISARRIAVGLLLAAGCSGGSQPGAAKPVIASFTATPASITSGQAVTLQWSVTDATALTIPGIGAVTGASVEVHPTQTTTYALIATSAGGETNAETTVTVQASTSAPVINAFTAYPMTIALGDNTLLAWDVSNATGVSLSGTGTVTGNSQLVTPTATTTYTLTASGTGGPVTAQVTVTVDQAPSLPVIQSFAASDLTVTPGTDVTLSWSVTGATSLAIAGLGAVTGTMQQVTPSHTTTYVLIASNAAGEVNAQTTVTVQASGTGPTITAFTAFPLTITLGQSTRLTWDVANASSLSLSGTGTVTGTSLEVTPVDTTTYTLTASGVGNPAAAQVTVTVDPAPSLPVIQSFAASPLTITAGNSTTLSWAVTNATELVITGVGVVTGTSLNVSPTQTTTYELTATNANGAVVADTTVTVQPVVATVPAIQSFTASPGTISSGGMSTLSWVVTGATSLMLSGIGAVSGTSAMVSPAATTTYTLTATNTTGSSTATTTVTVSSSTMGSSGPFTTYFGGTGSGSLVGAPVTQAVPQAQPQNIPFGTILFVTQVPMNGFSTVSSSFSNHLGDINSAPRGGDLYLRYPDGTLRNLTQEAGYGQTGLQGATAIAVRDPSVHWSATKAVFSMVIGAPQHYATTEYYWQLYEVTGLGLDETATITQVPGQPQGVDNVSPIYGTDGRVIFMSSVAPFGLTSERIDEYETAPAISGIWSLDPTTSDLKILFNTPSGCFDPMIDSFGRVLWTNWDHLQRDQQSDTNDVLSTYHPVDCTDEKSNATCVNLVANSVAGDSPPSIEMFPEPRVVQTDNPMDYSGHGFNQFFPWMMAEDGTAAETLNHVGAHEFGTAYQGPAFMNDPTLTDISAVEAKTSLHANRNYLKGQSGLFHLAEDPTTPGRYYWNYAPEFHSMNGGDLGYVDASPSVNPQQMVLTLLTNTGIFPGEDATQDGHYRDPLPLTDGTLVASYTSEVQSDYMSDFTNEQTVQEAALADGGTYGGQTAVAALYDYHLVHINTSAAPYTAGTRLTTGITKSITFYDPDDLVTFSGPLWELQPVEVRARAIPARFEETTYGPTTSVFTETGVSEGTLQAWLIQNNLALITSFNVTQRDAADTTQPYNLEVKDPDAGTIGAISKVGSAIPRDVSYLQFIEGDALRAFRGYQANNPVADARRIVGEPVTDARLASWMGTNGAPTGAVTIASDGSMAAFVPAQKPLSWQLLGPDGSPVVRERYWLTFAAGEIRTCTNCHGINELSQTGQPPPTNEPAALRSLLTAWLQSH